MDQGPASGNIALINGPCNGTTGQCTTQFAGTANSLKSDVLKVAAVLSSTNYSFNELTMFKLKN